MPTKVDWTKDWTKMLVNQKAQIIDAPPLEVQPEPEKKEKTMLSEKDLKEKLKNAIVGQDAAIDALSRAVVIASLGVCDPSRPLGTFLFLGPTGVGKSQIGRSLATILHGDGGGGQGLENQGLLVINCTEFKSSHEVSKITGAPPGYVGHEQPAFITPEKLQLAKTIVIFEEIEKADKALYDLLLQVLDRGELTTSRGESLNFRKCFIILTSNIGGREIDRLVRNLGVGFEPPARKFEELGKEEADDKIRAVSTKAMEDFFSPEFINRMDEIITFNHLSELHLTEILNKFLADARSRIACAGILVSVSANAKRFLIRKGTNFRYGARPLRRAVRRYLEYPVAAFILEKTIGPGHRIEVDVRDWEKNEELSVRLIKQKESVATEAG